jgi:hypothetical protein
MPLVQRFFVAAALALAASTAFAQATLDGRRFHAESGFPGKPAHIMSDVLSFDSGRFHSSDCDQYGYDKGAYKATASGATIAFEAETKSDQYGRNTWKGTIRGDQIEGTMIFYRRPTWWRPNPEPIEHWFRGTAMR